MGEGRQPAQAGPILHFRGIEGQAIRLAAIVIRRDDTAPGSLRAAGAEIAPRRLAAIAGITAWRYDFTLAAGDPGYELEGEHYEVATEFDGDLRIAFVSCNGEENGDLDRDGEERNLMWARLARDHARAPFALLLQGGDQVYADEATQGHPLSHDWPDKASEVDDPAALAGLAEHLRHRFVERYLHVLQARGYAWMAARVPVLSVWDDHDICDGWGSLPEKRSRSAVGRTLFAVARETYLLFQHGAVEGDIPDLFLDASGASLSWKRELPGLTIAAPDLRSERDRHRILGPAGWRAVEALAPRGAQVFLVSSVPLLGPRLSLLERLMMAIPRMQHYEDDLRDQWQSRAHREEWQRMLREVLKWRTDAPVTALSGEIHLATRAVMGPDAQCVHQLVASGISHRAPPKAYARSLGLFAGLGEAPLPGHPIRIHPLPGQRHRYVAERNYLTLARRDGRWQAVWHLEDSGETPALDLSD
ncbi:alkaline phosphatase D family protein [Paracoccus sp. TOH]|uniref:alkaline phosphatase D family protein n=1 Tax=Paracoccus sp. TOH TaxID=1263728 RepID=UPI0025B19C9F|nr:alkaline phosphatase D family protein [Paracoccus sp. TOH]WJS84285.1 alkaline phosphatase D family protein [Paracoccus sp. TOH]